ncbi:MAG: hypothetical protein OXE78_02855 [Gammaproteobacteria bacterium]|nr:hypothetical protein [Gammaproteobacteria bacterium]MCY4358677.1 hypothetical protein [Gammaproteobacteria bacterium]
MTDQVMHQHTEVRESLRYIAIMAVGGYIAIMTFGYYVGNAIYQIP